MKTGMWYLFSFVASHGHRCKLRADHIDLWIAGTDGEGNEIEEHYEIWNLKQAREALGY